MATVIIPNFNTQKTYIGLNTYQYTVPASIAAGTQANIRLEVLHNQDSNLTASIVQAGSLNTTLATTTVNPTTQPDTTSKSSVFLLALTSVAAGDTISFTISSSTSADEQLNTVKSNMVVNLGATS